MPTHSWTSIPRGTPDPRPTLPLRTKPVQLSTAPRSSPVASSRSSSSSWRCWRQVKHLLVGLECRATLKSYFLKGCTILRVAWKGFFTRTCCLERVFHSDSELSWCGHSLLKVGVFSLRDILFFFYLKLFWLLLFYSLLSRMVFSPLEFLKDWFFFLKGLFVISVDGRDVHICQGKSKRLRYPKKVELLYAEHLSMYFTT